MSIYYKLYVSLERDNKLHCLFTFLIYYFIPFIYTEADKKNYYAK